jgi:nucleotide-binding universal stress UspA family protein
VNPDRINGIGPVPPGAGIYAQRMRKRRLAVTKEHIEASLSMLVEKCQNAGVRLDVEHETGDSLALMTSHARYHDLTIFGLRSLFEYQLVDEPEKDLIALLSKGVRPILAVSNQFRPISNVLVAYSGSMESAKALRHYVQFNLWPDAAVNIVNFSRYPEEATPLLKDAAAYCRDHGFTVKTHIAPGEADRRLLDIARNMEADLIVMGNSIRSIWLRKALGDTLLDTLTRADRPLFLSQ